MNIDNWQVISKADQRRGQPQRDGKRWKEMSQKTRIPSSPYYVIPDIQDTLGRSPTSHTESKSERTDEKEPATS